MRRSGPGSRAYTTVGAKFGKNTYKVSASLHGIGAKAVTALSSGARPRSAAMTASSMEFERGAAILIGVSTSERPD